MQPGQTIVAGLERTVERYPDRCAMVQDDAPVSYSQLWQQAMAVAGYLQRAGLVPGNRVALILKNSPEYVAAYYGTLLAGGIVVALNAAAKDRDLALWLRHAGAAWLFAGTGHDEIGATFARETLPLHIIRVGALSDPAAPAQEVEFQEVILADQRPRPVRLDGHDLASILYTSGTTGNPKGVVLSHANLASNTSAIIEYLALGSNDSIVATLPFYYSYGNSVLHTHLAVGARLVLAENLVYPHLIVQRIAHDRVTGFAGVPSTFALLLSRVAFADYDFSSLRYVTQAGGPMAPELTRRLRAALPKCRIFVMYGQTEATARLTYLPPERLDEKMGSVGIPIAGVQIEVRSEAGFEAGRGEIGEVWVHGPNVMTGYWRDAHTTAATLREGWLKTGDSGYLDQDGFLYLVGRRSDIIKTGAHRVHPKDVEDVLAEVAGIEEVAVVGVDDDILGQVIKAYIVAAPGVQLDLMQIKAHTRAQLASYKVPKYLELVAALPKTTSGKVRRVELAERKMP